MKKFLIFLLVMYSIGMLAELYIKMNLEEVCSNEKAQEYLEVCQIPLS